MQIIVQFSRSHGQYLSVEWIIDCRSDGQFILVGWWSSIVGRMVICLGQIYRFVGRNNTFCRSDIQFLYGCSLSVDRMYTLSSVERILRTDDLTLLSKRLLYAVFG